MTMNDMEKYPNLLRVAQELARCKHPDKVFGALKVMIENGRVEGVREHG